MAAATVMGLSLLERAAFTARDLGVEEALVVCPVDQQAELRAAFRRTDVGIPLQFLDPVADAARIERTLDREHSVAVLRADVAYGRGVAAAVKAAPGGAISFVTPGARQWTGIARVPGWLASGLALAETGREGELLDHAVEEGTVRAEVAAPTFLSQPVRGREDRKAASRVLIRSLLKPTDGAVSRHLNRPISTTISRLLANTRVTPNATTFVVLLINLAGCALMAFGDAAWTPIAALAILQLGSILDGCDGELARLRYQSSAIGEWFDSVNDHTSTLLTTAAITYHVWRHEHSPTFLVLGIGAFATFVVTLSVIYAYMLQIRSGNTQRFPIGVATSPSSVQGALGKMGAFFASLAKRDSMILAMGLIAATGQLRLCLPGMLIGGSIAMVLFVRRFLQIQRARAVPGPQRLEPAPLPATSTSSEGIRLAS